MRPNLGAVGSSWPLATKARAGLIASLLIQVAFLVADPRPVDERLGFMDVGQTIAAAVAAVCCGLAARQVDGRVARWSWLLLTAAYVSNLLGETLWGFYELVLGIEAPTPSFGDLAYGLYYPLAFLGLLLRVKPGDGGLERLIILLDSLMFTAAAFGLSWVWILGPSLSREQDPLLAIVTISWPLGDLLLLLAIVSALPWSPGEKVRFSSIYLFASFVAMIVADTIFMSGMMEETAGTNGVPETAWSVSYAVSYFLTAFGALRARSDSSQGSSSEGQNAADDFPWAATLRMVIPYISVPAAAWLLYTCVSSPEHVEGETAYATAASLAVFVLVLLRQLVTLTYNHRLSVDLRRLSNELENRVEARTAELSILNRISAGLSRAETSESVLNTGLRAACETLEMPSGAAWVFKPTGEAELAARYGFSQAAEGLFSALPSNMSPWMEEVRKGHPLVLNRHDILRCYVHPEIALNLRRCLLLVPMVARGSVVGAVGTIGDVGEDRRDASCALLEAIASEMGVALESSQRYEHAAYLTERDPVTALHNHRAFHNHLKEELKRQQRAGRQFSLLMMDVDGFKLFNDSYGHLTGDRVLRQIATVLADSARESDVIARFGGDEFSAILPDTAVQGAMTFSERVREILSDRPFTRMDGGRVPLTMSFGIATYPEDGHSVQELIDCAGANLLRSKEGGGDSITASEDAPGREIAKLGSFGILDGLVTAIDHKDRYTRRHSAQVTEIAVSIASTMRLSTEALQSVRIAGLLHDVGKIGVPDRILRKPGRLEKEEFEVIKQHALLGEMIVKDLPNVASVVSAIGSHHERFDGLGYPRGLKGTDIPLLGRILAVADAYSAMTTDRPYRQAMRPEEAREEILKVAGTQLDPDVVQVFASLELLGPQKTAVLG